MPYIATETVKMIRTKLKKQFPNVKLSVTRHNYSALTVAVMESDIDFGVGEYAQLNAFYIEKNFEKKPRSPKVSVSDNGNNPNITRTKRGYL